MRFRDSTRCGAVFVVIPKVGCDVDDVEYCPMCGSSEGVN